ncbi:MAG TPA: glycosyltransferase family 4 protein [Coxiellaceae bacterium]|nr:glycosyltransferase family 4 protein [Coxiellaceae bacterium]
MKKILMIGVIDAGLCNASTLHFFSVAKQFSLCNYVEAVILKPYKKAIAIATQGFKIHMVLKVGFLKLPNFIIGILQIPWIFFHVCRNHFDIVYIRNYNFSFFLIALLRLTKVHIVSEHNGWISDELLLRKCPSILSWIGEQAQILSAKFSHSVRVVTLKLGTLFEEKGVKKQKIFYVGNGTDTQAIRPFPRNQALRHLNLDPNYFYCGFIGTLHAWQGVIFALKALDKIRTVNQKIKLIIAGDGPELTSLKMAAKNRGLEDCVIFLGHITYPDLKYILNAFDIALAPFIIKRNTRIGLSPLKIRDYAATGLPTIAADIPGVSELAKHQWLICHPPEDSEALADIILNLAPKKAELENMKIIARQYAEKHFDWSNIAKNIMEEIQARVNWLEESVAE